MFGSDTTGAGAGATLPQPAPQHLGDGGCGGSSSQHFPARRSLCGGITVVVAGNGSGDSVVVVVVAGSGVLCTRVSGV